MATSRAASRRSCWPAERESLLVGSAAPCARGIGGESRLVAVLQRVLAGEEQLEVLEVVEAPEQRAVRQHARYAEHAVRERALGGLAQPPLGAVARGFRDQRRAVEPRGAGHARDFARA